MGSHRDLSALRSVLPVGVRCWHALNKKKQIRAPARTRSAAAYVGRAGSGPVSILYWWLQHISRRYILSACWFGACCLHHMSHCHAALYVTVPWHVARHDTGVLFLRKGVIINPQTKGHLSLPMSCVHRQHHRARSRRLVNIRWNIRWKIRRSTEMEH